MKQHCVFTALLVTSISLTDISEGAQWNLTQLSSGLSSALFKHTQSVLSPCWLSAGCTEKGEVLMVVLVGEV